jgi:hypothetical protein
MAMSCIKSRILQGIIDGIEGDTVSEEHEEMLEQIRRTLDLPRMVPEIALTSDRVTPEHFLQWDPRVFLPGTIWNTVFPPLDRAVTESGIYLFVAVLFSVDNKMRAPCQLRFFHRVEQSPHHAGGCGRLNPMRRSSTTMRCMPCSGTTRPVRRSSASTAASQGSTFRSRRSPPPSWRCATL